MPSLLRASRQFLTLPLVVAMAGCGGQPAAVLQTTSATPRAARSPVMTHVTASPVAPRAAASVVTTRVSASPVASRIAAPVAPPEEPTTTLFADRYDPSARYVSDSAEEEALGREVAADAEAAGGPAVGPVARPWGLIGGAIAGTALFGYAAYAGLVGSRDLLMPKDRSTFKQSPAAFGWAFDDVRFKGHDGTDLAGWYIPAARPTQQAILLLHGTPRTKTAPWRAMARGCMTTTTCFSTTLASTVPVEAS